MFSLPRARNALCLFACIAIFGFVAGYAAAGPGHDHGHSHGEASPAKARPASPRISAISDRYEFVGILKAGALAIYLDRLDDTSPVVDASIELTIDGEVGKAELRTDGSYTLRSPTLVTPGEKEVIVTVTQGANSDLLIGTLNVVDAGHSHGDDGLGHDHSVHHVGEGEETSPLANQLTELFGLVGLPAEPIMRKVLNPPVLAGLGLVAGLLLGVFFTGRKGVVAALACLVVVVGAGTVWATPAHAGPGHDHGHDHGGGGGSAGVNGDAPQRLVDGSVFVPKPTQRLLEIRTRILAPETVRTTSRLIGRVVSDPNRSGLVQSTIGGRVKPPKGGLPVLGQRVKAGDVLAFIEPAFAAIDASDVRQTAGELEQQMALIVARIARQERLVAKNVASRANLEDLQIELKGLEARRASLSQSQRQAETLVSPVDGIVADVRMAAGQVIATTDILVHVLDPTSLWVEAVTFETGFPVADAAARAKTVGGAFFDLKFIGRSRALQQLSTTLQFRIDKPNDNLSVGAPVKVLLESGDPIEGLIVPRAAIAQAPNGQSVVFKRLEPERYEPVAVRLEDIDGQRVRIIAGLEAGAQIIVHNAPLVNQIR